MLTTQLQKYSPTPLIIAADVEGGQVNRLKPELGFIKIPSAQDMGKGDFSQTLAISRLVAEQLAEMGINANLAPDVDVNINPDNPIIGKRGRSFSEDPQIVFGHAMAFITSHREKNIITAAKHFLGHGSSDKDTHKGLVDVTHSYKKEAELLPFSRLIEAHAIDMIMTAHVMHRDFDPEYPATMSSKIIQDLLRGQLGFDGVVISDDLGMGAIVQEYSFDEAILRSLMAGCDLLIVARNIKDMFPADLLVESSGASALGESAAKHAIDVICQAVKDGRLSKARVLEAYERVIKLKKKYGIIKD
jgi:beta-N-acetylhexosaminidase